MAGGIHQEWGKSRAFLSDHYTGLRMALGVPLVGELFTVAEMAEALGEPEGRNYPADRRADRRTAGSRRGYGTVFPGVTIPGKYSFL